MCALENIALHIFNYSYTKFHVCLLKCIQSPLWIPSTLYSSPVLRVVQAGHVTNWH